MPVKIYKRGDVWHYAGTVDGRRLRGSTRTTDKTTAQRIAAEKEQRAWKRRLDGPESVTTFANCVALYQAAGKPTRFILQVLDYWRDTPVKQITARAIKDSAPKLYQKAGPATWNRQVIVPTQAIINYASELELCPPIRVMRFKTVKKEKEPATLEWVRSFMSSAGSPQLAALALFMFSTGARISESISVLWSDVDMTARTVKIRMGKLGGDERNANLPPDIIAALANIEGPRDGKVFPWKHQHNIKTQWEGAIRRAGIKRLTPHSCRHGFATSLLQAGVDVRTVAELGGWKTPALVLSTYSHAMRDPRVTDILFAPKLTQSNMQTTKNIVAAKA